MGRAKIIKILNNNYPVLDKTKKSNLKGVRLGNQKILCYAGPKNKYYKRIFFYLLN